MTQCTASANIMTCAILLLSFTIADAISWLDADIGAPGVAGNHVELNGSLTVTGAGAGATSNGADQLHYTHTNTTDSNLEVTARLVSFSGNRLGNAGIMLRSDNGATAVTASIMFVYQAADSGRHQIIAVSNSIYSGSGTRMRLPLWLRVSRIGKNYAVCKSQDGKIWSLPSNVSGGGFVASGSIEAGFFAAGGSAATTGVATFDSITIVAAKLSYETSWIGNSFGGDAAHGHVSNQIAALWTGPDGSCYTNSYYDEAGEALKIYKDGKIVKALAQGENWRNEVFGNSACGEGSIAGSDSDLFVASGKGLYQCDLFAHSASIRPLYLSVSPWDSAKNINIISGLAYINQRLYIGDSRQNLIRVADTKTPIYYPADNYGSVTLTAHTIDTAGIAHAAPPEIYQSCRMYDWIPYTIPRLNTSTMYTLRCHFAEYTGNPSIKLLIDIAAGGQWVTGYDAGAAAGGAFKPAVLDISNVRTDASGALSITFGRSTGGCGYGLICGFEILKPDGSRAFALNCGGMAVGDFAGEVYELRAQAFSFTRPGPMVADKRGDLWIIQEANDFPIGTAITTKYPGAVRCFRTAGTFTGREITDVANPTAVVYDSLHDQLLIADNGPNQNVRIYGNLGTAPSFVKSFGAQGGLFSGAHAGLINDPVAGGYARFYGLTGVGVDAPGNIYVSCSANGSDLRKFTSSGDLVWMLNGIPFCNSSDFDPQFDGTEVYTPYWHATLDYSRNTPGGEWKYTAFNWNTVRNGTPPDQGNRQAIIRRLGPNKERIMFTSGQGNVQYIGIFRYDGEIAIPCGRIDGIPRIWIDKNGDGTQTPDEVTGSGVDGMGFFHVDKKGDIWTATACEGYACIRHFPFKGLNASGVPMYSDYEHIPYPLINGNRFPAQFHTMKVHYDSDNDVMYLVGSANVTAGDPPVPDPQSYAARYDNWSSGNRTERWRFMLQEIATDNNFMYDTKYWGLFGWMGFDIAGDKMFLADLYGPVRVYDAASGSLQMILNPGPEVSGMTAWEDATMGLRAFKRENGEYVVFTENSGYNAKINMFRIPPPGGPSAAISDTKSAAHLSLEIEKRTLVGASARKVRFYARNAGVEDRRLTVKVYTLRGSLVKDLSTRGDVITWDMTATHNSRVSAGMYLYAITLKTKTASVSKQGSCWIVR